MSIVERRLENATTAAPPDRRLLALQRPIADRIADHYFRAEVEGWERVPDEPSLVISVHAGSALPVDAWVFVHSWYRHFGGERILHGTAHDVLMALPGMGDWFSAAGVIPGMSTSWTRTASTRPGHPRRPSSPVRRLEAIPLSQSALASTVAPERSALRHTSTARAPSTTSTGSHTAAAVRTARSTSRLPSYSTRALGIP